MADKKDWFNDCRQLDMIAWESRMADWPRSLNRARINELYNGGPPYSQKQVEENGIEFNVNFLEPTRLAHDSRMQFMQGFVKPGRYFTATTDYGPKHKRADWSARVSRHVNRMMKRSPSYFEVLRGQFAQLVLHGIAPSVWENRDCWCPRVVGIDDAFLPSGTLVGFENAPRVIFYRTFTAMELQKLTETPGVDPGWNMPYVKRLLEWLGKEGTRLMGNNWPEIWSPEKLVERQKSGSVFSACDSIPTIKCFDFYIYVDDGKKAGWVRRIILDAWGDPTSTGASYAMTRKEMGGMEQMKKDDFLYDSNKRTVADDLSEIANFQFADLSAVAPFRYHSVRSLGYLMFAVCHLQNRLRCKFAEAQFEALTMYFRVNSDDDAQRAMKVNLIKQGFIDKTIEFIPANQRFQAPWQMIQLGLQENANIIQSNASSFTPSADMADRTEKTKFQVMAELNTSTALVSAALSQAYQYKTFEYEEVFRRCCQKNSKDAAVRDFQAACVRDDIPPAMLSPERWDIVAERIMGGGNKTMELAIVEQLMQWRNLYDPSTQRVILREATSALTDNPDRADSYVPEQPHISDSVHDAQLTAGALMQGLPVAVKPGINHTEYVEALMASMAVVIKKIQDQQKGVATMDQLIGLSAINQNITGHIEIIAQDEEEQQRVKQYGDQLGKLMNMVKAFAQRFLEQEQAKNGDSQIDPQALGKIKAMTILAQAKADNMRETQATKQAQKGIAFEADQSRKDQQTAAEIERANRVAAQELSAEQARVGQEIEVNAVRGAQEISHAERKAKKQE